MKHFKYIALTGSLAMLGLNLAGCTSTSTAESTGEYIDSTAVTAKIKTALLKAEGLNYNSISVTTYKGNVQWSGFVDTPSQVIQAQNVAQNVPGVVKVENNLIVKTANS